MRPLIVVVALLGIVAGLWAMVQIVMRPAPWKIIATATLAGGYLVLALTEAVESWHRVRSEDTEINKTLDHIAAPPRGINLRSDMVRQDKLPFVGLAKDTPVHASNEAVFDGGDRSPEEGGHHH